MKTGIKKSTAEEVALMRELFQQNWSYGKIGQQFKKDRTTIMYWIKKLGLPIKKSEDRINGRILANINKETQKLAEVKIDRSLCFICHKKKENLIWIKTRYCGIDCYSKNLLLIK